MSNQYTNPRKANFRYLGNQIWERVDRYKFPEDYSILTMPDDFRFPVYAFFDSNDGAIVRTLAFFEIPDCMLGKIVSVPRAFWHNFNEEWSQQ